MDLSKLVAPEGEKTVLMVGEDHYQDSMITLLSLCHAFKPDVIAIESDADRMIRKKLTITLESACDYPQGFTDYREYTLATGDVSSLSSAAIYAAQSKLPLYLIDWHPTHPGNIGDWFSGEAPRFVYTEERLGWASLGWAGLGRSFDNTIETLLGFREKMEALNMQAETYKVLARDKGEGERRFIWYNTLCETPHGILIRNEYTAMALNSIDAERILYVGGAGHFRPVTTHLEDWHQRFDFITPLQDLVVADNKYYVDLPALRWPKHRQYAREELGTDEFPIKITKTVQPRLEWQNLEYFK